MVKVIVLVDRCQGGSDELRRRGYDLVCLMHATPEGTVEVSEDFASQGSLRSQPGEVQ